MNEELRKNHLQQLDDASATSGAFSLHNLLPRFGVICAWQSTGDFMLMQLSSSGGAFQSVLTIASVLGRVCHVKSFV